MKLSVREFFVMLIVAVGTIAILWGGQRIYQNSAVRSPLLRSVEAVRGVQMAKLRPQGTLNVRLKQSANLMTTYQAIEARAQASLPKAPQLVIINAGDGPLNALANRVKLMVAQGEATGQYVAMSQQIGRFARAQGVHASIALGNYNVFVSLQAGSHYVDQVIPLSLGGKSHA